MMPSPKRGGPNKPRTVKAALKKSGSPRNSRGGSNPTKISTIIVRPRGKATTTSKPHSSSLGGDGGGTVDRSRTRAALKTAGPSARIMKTTPTDRMNDTPFTAKDALSRRAAGAGRTQRVASAAGKEAQARNKARARAAGMRQVR